MTDSIHDIRDTLKRMAIILAIVVCFHWAPDAYVWFSSNVLGRGVVINARRYEFILLVAHVVGGTGLVAGAADIIWTLIKRRRLGAK